MRVLHVITGLEPGGAEIQLAMTVERSSHEVDVVTLYNRGPVADRIESSGVCVRDLQMKANTQLSVLPRLWSIVRSGGYDVVHAHLYRSQIYGLLAGRLAGAPVVVSTEHSIGETHIERRRMTGSVRLLYLFSQLFSDTTVAVSEVVRERIIRWGVPEDKIVVIPNGLDSRAFSFDSARRHQVREQFGIRPDAYVIGALGRLDPNKRVDLAIEAAAPLLGNRCKMLIVGGGAEREHLIETASHLGVAEDVIFTGYQEDSRAMLSAMDLYTALSGQETFGLAVLEALASGLPVIYTTCPALEGIETDRAVEVRDDPAEIRAVMQRLYEKPIERLSPREVLDRFAMEDVVQRTDDLYETIYAKHRWRARRAELRRSKALSRGPCAAPPRPRTPVGLSQPDPLSTASPTEAD